MTSPTVRDARYNRLALDRVMAHLGVATPTAAEVDASLDED